MKLPWVTVSVTAAGLLLAAVMYAAGVSPWMASSHDVVRWGGSWGWKIVTEHQWWRLITAGFVHGGIWHLGINLSALWTLGPTLEFHLGAKRYALLYLVCLLEGSLASLLYHPQVVACGSSGAIFGLAGAALALLWLEPEAKSWPARMQRATRGAPLGLLAMAALPVDNAAHLGGFVAGLLLGASVGRLRLKGVAPAVALATAVLAVAAHGHYQALPQTRAYRLLEEARRAEAAGDLQTARQRAEEAVALEGNDAPLWVYLGDNYRRGGDLERAHDAFVHAQQLPGGEPLASASLCVLGKTDAAQSCDRAFAGSLSPELAAWVHQGRAQLRAKARNWEGVLEDGEAALAAGGDSGELRYVRALAAIELGRRDQAEAEIAKMKKLAPDGHLDIQSADLYLRLGRYREALAAAERAEKHGTERRWTVPTRALARYLDGSRAEGLATLEGGLAELTPTPTLYALHAWMLRYQHRPADAVAECDRALELDGDHYDALSVRCWAEADLGRAKEAIADCRRAVALRADATDESAMIDYLEKRPAEAVRRWEARLRIHPESAPFVEPYLGRARAAVR